MKVNLLFTQRNPIHALPCLRYDKEWKKGYFKKMLRKFVARPKTALQIGKKTEVCLKFNSSLTS